MLLWDNADRNFCFFGTFSEMPEELRCVKPSHCYCVADSTFRDKWKKVENKVLVFVGACTLLSMTNAEQVGFEEP